MESALEEKLHQAEEKVRTFLARHGVELATAHIVLDAGLDKGALATHRYPATVVVRDASVPESVIAHELVHIAQGTLEQFRGFQLLYSLLAEGLADWVAKQLYPDHPVKYQDGYRLIELVVTVDAGAVGDALRLHQVRLEPGDLDAILSSPHLAAASRELLGQMSERIRQAIGTAVAAGITDPTFVPLGEELQAWKFLLDRRFDRARQEVDRVVGEWFGQKEVSEC
jgi:hypothetical protein